MTKSNATEVYQHKFTVPQSAMDQNGHVNNVVYVQWMQDVAILHFDAIAGSQVMEDAGVIWVARSHAIEYLSPAFADDEISALTWVVDFRRVRSVRRYKFLRSSDGTLLAEGETAWVCVDAESGRPRKIPDKVIGMLPQVPDPLT